MSTYCVHPFRQVAVKKFVNGKPVRYAPCCNVHLEHRWDLPNADPTPSELFESDEMNELRDFMRKGIRHKACSICWEREDAGLKSFRIEDPHNEEEELNTIDIAISNICNLACRMCTPSNSALLMKDHKHWLENDIEHDHLRPHWYESVPFESSKSNFYDYLFNNTDKIKTIKVTGGEPFYDKQGLKIVDKYIENDDAKNTVLKYTTNGTCFTDELMDKINEFKEVNIHISCDGVGSVYDYIRHGSTFDDFLDNVENFINKTNNTKYLNLSFVIQAYNLHCFDEFIDHFKYYFRGEVSFAIFPVGPEKRGIHPKHLPVSYLKMIQEKTGHDHIAKEQFHKYIQHWIDHNEENLPLLKREVLMFDKSRDQHYGDYLDPILTSHIDAVDPL